MNAENKRSYVGIIIRTIFYIIAVFIMIIFGSIIYKAKKYPNKIPDIFGIKPMIVLSESMETKINKGDLVFVEMIDADTLKEDDIIAFRNEDNTVTTHRIVEIIKKDGKRYFRTKGDNNSEEDMNVVDTSSVEGIYKSKISGIGHFLMFIKEPIGLAFILLAILFVGLIWLRIAERVEQKEKK